MKIPLAAIVFAGLAFIALGLTCYPPLLIIGAAWGMTGFFLLGLYMCVEGGIPGLRRLIDRVTFKHFAKNMSHEGCIEMIIITMAGKEHWTCIADTPEKIRVLAEIERKRAL